MNRSFFLSGLLFCCCGFDTLRGTDLSASYDWKPMKVGGGGWVVGMDISPTEKNLIYIRTDVSGGYRWNAETSTWKQVVTSSSMPKEYVEYGKYSGVDSLVSAPKDPNVAYMAFSKQVFRSADRGETWKATTFGTHDLAMDSNGEGRQEGERLAVDPNNSDIVYYASIANGLWLTPDGGATWSKVAAIPAGKLPHGVNTVVFDKGSATLPAKGETVKTSVLYVTVEEAGIFKSADAGATWTNIAASATGTPGPGVKVRNAKIGPDRTYFVACDNDKGAVGSVWKLNVAGEWTNITPPPPNGGSQSYVDIAVDPFDAHHLLAMENGGKCFLSTDQGATWTYHFFRLESAKIEWLGKQENYWLSVGELAFDPFDRGKLWFAEGFGVWWAKDLAAVQIPWQAESAGIEEVCAREIVAPPGGKPVGAVWDAGVFYFSDPDVYTAKRALPYFMACWSIDWCPADPKFIAALFRNNLNFGPMPRQAGYSTDGGLTWKRFPAAENKTLPPGLDYGIVAVSANTPDHIAWCPAFTKLPFYTADRGATWQQSDCGELKATGMSPIHSGQRPICADRVLPDTFYLYTTSDGVYRSTDGGAHYAKVGGPSCPGRTNALLKAVPGHGGDLWFAEESGGGLWHSTDGGAKWEALPGFQRCMTIGFGKAQTEDGYPTLYVDAIRGGVTGIYRSTDTGATWDKICDYPLGLFEWVNSIDGDKEVFGKVYLGFAQAGFAYGALKEQSNP
ncbi:hypothetical protein SAMN05444156_0484 [Verrucomicrobium sp. GAS474]|uniref:sialidase n=1 Tax=Verrucomicrobium sp. GAS474 TaxID=1882831 RepID=UPI00087D66E8|nr:sialidase [Verrucomicrobium sp. GAS474]SDT89199.1 hypothetical protein SAMN05444156_0484 [Verrucomicrobium sp. GAS474]